MQHGLRREDRALFNNIVSKSSIRRIQEENSEFVGVLAPEFERLYKSLGSSQWLVIYVNRSGEVVHTIGDRTSAPRELRVLMQPGRRLTEAELGTTAPGCALESGAPVVVSRGEHYLIELKNFFCASTPIVAPDGKLVGVLDISGVDVNALPLASEMVNLAARRIENELLLAMQDCIHLRFHFDEQMLATPLEGILAVHPDGTIQGANRVARRLVVPGDGALIGSPLEAILDSNLATLLEASRLGTSQPSQVQSRWGGCAYLSVIPKRSTSAAPATNKKPTGTPPSAGRIFMEDAALQSRYSQALQLLRRRLPILLTGETGTGKEVIARSLHVESGRTGPFVALNCAAIPETLVESELFGYAEGTFTGGHKGGAAGRIEQAHGGVLFLDEIGDMPVAMQARLLRVLQQRAVSRLGDSRELPVDFDLICATHRDLSELLAAGKFREDLYYRVAGFTLTLPPLRERDDIKAIIAGLLRHWIEADEPTANVRKLSQLITAEALESLMRYEWPGNIRQLDQVIRVLATLRRPGVPIEIVDLPDQVRKPAVIAEAPAANAGALLKSAEISVIRRVLEEHRGNISAAARVLGISRNTLYSRLRACDRSTD